MSNEDSQLMDIRNFQTEDIARIFRVPQHLIGYLQRSTNNNIEHQSIEFVKFTMGPWLRRWEEAIERDLLLDDRFYVKFNFDGLLRGDSASRTAFYREMVNTGIFSINECRELEDMNPIEGGDVHLVQGAMKPLDLIFVQPEPQKPKLSAEAIELTKGLIADRVSRMQRIEQTRVQQLAKQPAAFLESLSAFYADHGLKYAEALEGPMQLYVTLAEPLDWRGALNRHLLNSKQTLEAIYQEPAKLAEWTSQDRTGALLQELTA